MYSTEVSTNIRSALDALEQHNFSLYIYCLEQLGKNLERKYKAQAPKKIGTQKPEKETKIAWLENCIMVNQLKQKYRLQNVFSFCVFEEVWRDESLAKPLAPTYENKYMRHFSVKSNLSRSTRKHINFGMRALALSVNGTYTKKNYADIVKLNNNITDAIASYKTPKQMFLNIVGKVLAFMMALATGVTTGAAIIAATVTIWPIAAVIPVAIIIFAAISIGNWWMFRNAVPRVLLDMFGKDKLFEGWTNWNDDKTGVKCHLSTNRKLALIPSVLMAASVGIVNGALTYGFVLGLSKVAAFTFLAAGTIGGILLPPLGILLASIFCVCIAFLMINSFINLIKQKDLRETLKKPFRECARIFDKNHKNNLGKSLTRLKIEKGITYAIVGILCGIGLFGLVAIQLNGATSLGNLISQLFSLTSSLAVNIAYGISMTGALIGQIPFVIETTVKSIVDIAKSFLQLFSKNKKANVPQSGPILAITNVSKKIARAVLYVTAGIGNGGLVLNTFKTLALGTITAIAAGFNGMAPMIASNKKDEAKKIKLNASTARVMRILEINSSYEQKDEITAGGESKQKYDSSKIRYYNQYILSPSRYERPAYSDGEAAKVCAYS